MLLNMGVKPLTHLVILLLYKTVTSDMVDTNSECKSCPSLIPCVKVVL